MSTRSTQDLAGVDIAVDLDSTLWPLLDGMALHAGGERVNYADCESWNGLCDLCDGGLPGMLKLFDLAFTYETMAQVGPYAGAIDALRDLSARGARIHIMTERPDACADSTERLLRAWGVPFNSFTCMQPFNKVDLAIALGCTIVIDDNPKTIRLMHQAGLHVLALRFRYNAEIIDELDVDHADAWDGLTPLLRQAAAHAVVATTPESTQGTADRRWFRRAA